MQRIITSILVVLGIGQFQGYCQTQNDTLLAKDNVMFQLPTISVNFGVNHFMGDVALGKSGSSPITQFGYQLAITQPVTKFLNASFILYTGSVRGEEFRDSVTNLNFRTTLFSQQLSVEYNFYPLLKPKEDGRQLVRPYVGFGVGLLSFRSKGDLKNAAGVDYQYWSDGTIRAEIEGSIDPSESTILARDFEYETDLRDANLDGLRKYSQLAFTLPINAGVRFQVSKNIGVNAAFTYAFNFTDMIDNVSNESLGIRQGDKGFDNHLYGSIGVSVFLGRTKHSAKPKRFDNQIAAQSGLNSENEEESSSYRKETESKSEQSVSGKDELANIANDARNASNTLESGSERKLAAVVSTKQNVLATKTAIDKQLQELETVEKEVLSSSKIKNSQIQQVNEQLQVGYSNIEISKSLVQSDIQEPVTANKPTKEASSLTDKKILTKEDAISSINELKKELNTSISELNTEQTRLADEESQLTSFNVIRAKIRLMEKMNSKNAVKTSMSEEDRIKAKDSVLSELKALKTDTSSREIIDSSEIETLVKRVEDVKVSVQKSESAIAQSSTQTSATTISSDTKESNLSAANTTTQNSNNTGVPSETGKSESSLVNGSSVADAKTSENKGNRSVEEIKNAPPKVSGGFHWADVNKNGMISPDEVLYFIDALFEGESKKTVDDIQNLIDYYFDQE